MLNLVYTLIFRLIFAPKGWVLTFAVSYVSRSREESIIAGVQAIDGQINQLEKPSQPIQYLLSTQTFLVSAMLLTKCLVS